MARALARAISLPSPLLAFHHMDSCPYKPVADCVRAAVVRRERFAIHTGNFVSLCVTPVMEHCIDA